MSEYNIKPKKCYSYYGGSYIFYDVRIKKSFLGFSWWSTLVTCRYYHEVETLINNLNSINNKPKLKKGE